MLKPIKEEWKKHHKKRIKSKIKARMLFDKGTPRKKLINRNRYALCDTRYIPTDIKTKSWFFVYSDTVTIFLQEEQKMAVQIINKKIADTFRGIFEDYWKQSKKFR